jgi:hypothetical protein
VTALNTVNKFNQKTKNKLSSFVATYFIFLLSKCIQATTATTTKEEQNEITKRKNKSEEMRSD